MKDIVVVVRSGGVEEVFTDIEDARVYYERAIDDVPTSQVYPH